MGKAKTPRKAGASSSKPYDKSPKDATGGGKANNIFKFNTNIGQHILKNPGVSLNCVVLEIHLLCMLTLNIDRSLMPC